ncbi:MAG: GldG family protein [Lachnospiraceae bacterium]|nr:GldG family protein [Lachnospiraceae bacterium]
MANKQKSNNLQPKKEKSSLVRFSGNRFRNGSFSATMILIAIAIVVVLNLIVSKVPSKYRELDMSGNKLYTLDDQSEELLKRLDMDVTIYFLGNKSIEDRYPELSRLLGNYEDGSDKIKIVRKDPELYPNFGTKYEATSSTVLIVESEKRTKLIDGTDLYTLTNQEAVYYYGEAEKYEFNGENLIANAVNYVTTDSVPKLYTLTGHGETEFDDTLQEYIKNSNITLEELSLATGGGVPEDASCIAIIAPKSDLNDTETKAVSKYLEAGGNAMIFGSETNKELPNFNSLLEQYGVTMEEGIVYEGDANYAMTDSPTYIVPKVETHDANSIVNENNGYILMTDAKSIAETENHKDNISVTTLFSTTESSYRKENAADSKSVGKEKGDAEGPFALGVAITVTEGTEGETEEETESTAEPKTKLVVYGSTSLISQNIYMQFSYNVAEVLSSLGWMCDTEDSIAIAGKSISSEALTLTEGDVNKWMSVYLIMIPAITIAAGIFVTIRRNRK